MTQDQWTTVADVASAVCLLGGAFLAFAAGVGVLRFPDLLDAGASVRQVGRSRVLTHLPHRQVIVRHPVLARVRCSAGAFDRQRRER